MSDTFQVTRRQLLIGSLAATGAVLLARLPDLSALAATGQREKLYVNTDCNLALSLGDVAVDEIRPWTWRMVLAAGYEDGPDCPLSGGGLQYAGGYFGIDVDDDEFDEQAYQELLDEEHPDSVTGKLWNQYDEHIFTRGSVARAYSLFNEVLGDKSNLEVGTGEQTIPIAMQLNSGGKFIWLVDEQDIPRLEEALQKRGLPIEVVIV